MEKIRRMKTTRKREAGNPLPVGLALMIPLTKVSSKQAIYGRRASEERSAMFAFCTVHFLIASVDMEETVVRPTTDTTGLLQDECRVPTTSPFGTIGCPFLYTSLVEETRKHIRARLACTNVLSAGEIAGRCPGMDRSHR